MIKRASRGSLFSICTPALSNIATDNLSGIVD
ncbi:unnamed protein product [Schistosoma mattheei]|uniref:Uncharacterized protein n=2 Tax=Schistosoma TaxID=6181 RepID=A0A3P8AB28_9TREM|nr:unnamed protein product [Schistosoma margrebowiei]VDO93087.1 unnamed protein product [Schistosoma mattheei]